MAFALFKVWELGPRENVLGRGAAELGRSLAWNRCRLDYSLRGSKKAPSSQSERPKVKLKNPYVHDELGNVKMVPDIQPVTGK